MEEREIVAGLRAVALAEPPLGFDPDDLAVTGARRQTRRAVLGSAAAAVAVLVVTFAVVVALVPRHAAEPAGGFAPDRTAPPVLLLLGDQRHLSAAVPRVVPGASEVVVHGFRHGQHGGFTSTVTFRDTAGPAMLIVDVSAAQYPPLASVCSTPRLLPNRKPLRCDKFPRPDGSTVVLEEHAGSGAKGEQVVELDAEHYRPDGALVVISNVLVAFVDKGQQHQVDIAYRSRFPLTEPQLIALVTDPELRGR